MPEKLRSRQQVHSRKRKREEASRRSKTVIKQIELAYETRRDKHKIQIGIAGVVFTLLNTGAGFYLNRGVNQPIAEPVEQKAEQEEPQKNYEIEETVQRSYCVNCKAYNLDFIKDPPKK